MSETRSAEVTCCACLKSLKNKNTIFHLSQHLSIDLESSDEYCTISELFLKYTLLEYHQFPENVNYLCGACYKQLTNFHIFWKKCAASHCVLRNWYGKQTNGIIAEALEVKDIFEEISQENHVDSGEERNGIQKFVDRDEIGNISSQVSDWNTNEKLLNTNDLFEIDEVLIKVETVEENVKSHSGYENDINDKNVCGQKRNYDSSKNPTRDAFQCNICQKNFKVQLRYDGHMRKHQGLIAFPCQKCSKAFASINNFNAHMNAMHQSTNQEAQKFICGVNNCGKVYYLKVIQIAI